MDPQRGGNDPIDFIRPLFRIYNWHSSEVEIWTSPNGISWSKLNASQFAASYDVDFRILFVSLLFDLPDLTWLAFFDINGPVIPVGYTLEKYPVLPVGWTTEWETFWRCNAGWTNGQAGLSRAPAGMTIRGCFPRNVTIGWTLKSVIPDEIPVGFDLAGAGDNCVRIGFFIGTILSRQVNGGVTVMGASRFPSGFVCLDQEAFSSLGARAAIHKQRICTLSGTDPEVLD